MQLPERDRQRMSKNKIPKAHKPNLLVIMSDQHNPARPGVRGGQCRKNAEPRPPGRGRGKVRHQLLPQPRSACPREWGFLTSRHSSDIECWGNEDFLRSDIPTFRPRVSHCRLRHGSVRVECTSSVPISTMASPSDWRETNRPATVNTIQKDSWVAFRLRRHTTCQ